MRSISAIAIAGSGTVALATALAASVPGAQASGGTGAMSAGRSLVVAARHAKPSPKTTIATNWAKFFAGTTAPAEKIRLLENGQAFASVIDAQAKLTIAKDTTAKVLDVTLETASKASVRYSIEMGGAPVLSGQTGTSLEEAGLWKVSDASFCTLLALEGTKVKACPAPARAATVDEVKRGSFGTILVTSSGMTLYRDAKDTAGHSNCSGSCASIWPPLVLPKGSKGPTAGKGVTHLGTLRRSNGTEQVTYDGEPLYLYQGDKSPGQVNGDNIGGFSVIKPGSATRSTTTTSGSGYGY